MKTVLVTGGTGEVARGVLPFLEKEFDLRLLALDPAGDDPRRIQADLLDWDALARAMNGVDAVLHLACATGHSGTYEEDVFNDLRFDVNVKGTFHVFETARRLRVRRVVHVSSLMVTWGEGMLRQSLEEGHPELAAEADLPPVAGDARPTPVGSYALTKALGEAIASYYSQPAQEALSRYYSRDSLEVIALRMAAPLDLDSPEFRRKPVRPQQVPFPDLAQAFVKALTVPLYRFEVVTIVGDSSRRLWDLTPARSVLGYRPAYYLDDLGVTFADPFAVEGQ
jgi:uronate dehydrogenase